MTNRQFTPRTGVRLLPVQVSDHLGDEGVPSDGLRDEEGGAKVHPGHVLQAACHLHVGALVRGHLVAARLEAQHPILVHEGWEENEKDRERRFNRRN